MRHEVSLWIGLGLFAPFISVSNHFEDLLSFLSNKVNKSFDSIFWFAVFWAIWIVWNDTFFEGDLKGVQEIMELAKSLARDWLCSRT